MPYFDASPAALQSMFGIADGDLPDAAIIVGQWGQLSYFEAVRAIWPAAREIEEHSILVEERGRRVWISVVFGAPMAATIAHYAARLGARAIMQIGSMGGLVPGWQVGDVLVPSLVVGRDGVSGQVSGHKPIEPDKVLSSAVCDALLARPGLGAVRSGTLASTTTISLERPRDVARWRRHGFVGVEMECAATIGIARRLGVRAAGAFVLIDNLADGHTFFTLSDEDERRIRAGKEAILRASVTALIEVIGVAG